ncbi:lipopolysaccharide kinase InaA family protein [Thermodesulfobacterium sp. TA1]|uniref:lipopolysaccharide kinase InaA family protein n=1 Tax=Thermodesulfobacterium sp. TA1 TaxID=2234087 RepID=UPI00143DB178|nr:lipopolysaccharide kinase InaA family protein [Thermodesulfobacterium sp. TA1]
MSITLVFGFEVVIEHLSFFYKIFDKKSQNLFLPKPFFEREKRYRKVKGYEVDGQRFYIKKYSNCFEEANSEWRNLLRLRELGFSVPEPFFIRKRPDKLEIATFELKGKPLSELLKNKELQANLIYKLAELLSALHLKRLYHQDCYLNHFFWEEETEILGFLDVSRVLSNPRFSLKYQIKDLAQLGYSFEEYFGEKGAFLFQKFLSRYLELSKSKPAWLVKFLVEFKIWLIRRRTKRARLKGKKL